MRALAGLARWEESAKLPDQGDLFTVLDNLSAEEHVILDKSGGATPGRCRCARRALGRQATRADAKGKSAAGAMHRSEPQNLLRGREQMPRQIRL